MGCQTEVLADIPDELRTWFDANAMALCTVFADLADGQSIPWASVKVVLTDDYITTVNDANARTNSPFSAGTSAERMGGMARGTVIPMDDDASAFEVILDSFYLKLEYEEELQHACDQLTFLLTLAHELGHVLVACAHAGTGYAAEVEKRSWTGRGKARSIAMGALEEYSVGCIANVVLGAVVPPMTGEAGGELRWSARLLHGDSYSDGLLEALESPEVTELSHAVEECCRGERDLDEIVGHIVSTTQSVLNLCGHAAATATTPDAADDLNRRLSALSGTGALFIATWRSLLGDALETGMPTVDEGALERTRAHAKAGTEILMKLWGDLGLTEEAIDFVLKRARANEWLAARA